LDTSFERSVTGKDEWLTPPEIVGALGEFDLDPCAPADRPWDTAKHHYNKHDNGLVQPWHGRVWCNPPYGRETAGWMRRMAEHNNGIALIFARTETKTFFRWIWGRATAVMFLRGRLRFYNSDGSAPSNNAGAPSVLVAYGDTNAVALKASGLNGYFINLSDPTWHSNCLA
jgi:hypothetical protein